MAKKSDSAVASALLYVILGVLLIVFKSQTLGWAMTIAGAVFIISGVLDLVKGNVAGGAVSLIIGIAILVLGWTAVTIVLLVLGILMAVKGLVSLIQALKRKKKNVLAIIFALLTMVAGGLIIFGYASAIIDTVLLVAGILLVVDGVLGLASAAKK